MERVRQALVSGSYPGMGTGDPDLYKAFCWRFWHLTTTDGGRIGVVLPRSALAAKGSTEFRRTVFDGSAKVEIEMLLNRAGWVFDEGRTPIHNRTRVYHPRCAGEKVDQPSRAFRVIHDLRSWKARAPATFTREEVLSWNDTVSLPLLPSEHSVDVFAQLRKAPRLDLNIEGHWRARPDAELHATNEKKLMDLNSTECPKGFWPVYKGETFDLWSPDTGVYYAFADPKPTQERIQGKRLRASKSRRDTAHGEFPPKYLLDRRTLPCHAPRVAFRDVSRATDTRTVRVALLPPKVFVTNKGPYFLWPRGDEKDQAYLLGVLSSIPLDWYARRFVEINLNFFIINPFPVSLGPTETMHAGSESSELAGRIACPDRRFRTWAKAVGVECGGIADDEKEDMTHELDAVVAHLYGLSEAQLVHIFEDVPRRLGLPSPARWRAEPLPSVETALRWTRTLR